MAKKSATNPARHTFSRQLRDALASRGISCAEMAKLTGVDPSILSRFLSGEREIRSGTIDKLAEAFGLRIVETEERPKRKR